MKQRVIMPIFKDERDKIMTVTMMILSIFFVFIPALITMLFLKDKISENSYVIAKALLNFELLLFVISLLFFIPLIGWIAGAILGPILMIFNVIVMLLALLAMANNKEVKIPAFFEFI